MSELPANSCSSCCGHDVERSASLARALRLEWLTVGWNTIEAAVAIAAALAAGSTALLGFGIDSVVESSSGAILIWRLLAERRHGSHDRIETAEERARRLVAVSLFLLAAWIGFDAARTLIERERPRPSLPGIVITALSLVAMYVLARAKRRAADALDSRALAADAFQTTACFWLSLITLAGITLNATLGWWWADPVAALGMIWFVVSEAREAWHGEECGCH